MKKYLSVNRRENAELINKKGPNLPRLLSIGQLLQAGQRMAQKLESKE
jgi:hypothetical protein